MFPILRNVLIVQNFAQEEMYFQTMSFYTENHTVVFFANEEKSIFLFFTKLLIAVCNSVFFYSKLKVSGNGNCISLKTLRNSEPPIKNLSLKSQCSSVQRFLS